MRRLMLLRHAKAERPEGVTDHDRPLAARGQRESEAMGIYMAEQGLVPDLAIVSTARRTQETWLRVLPAFATKIPLRNDVNLYEASIEEVIGIIGKTESSVNVLMLVGHNPAIAEVALALVRKKHPSSALSELQQDYPTAGLAIIDFDAESWEEVAVSRGRLERFETPASVAH